MAELATIRFRLYDGTDLGPVTFPLSTPVGAVKEALFLEWPQVRRAPTSCPLQREQAGSSRTRV